MQHPTHSTQNLMTLITVTTQHTAHPWKYLSAAPPSLPLHSIASRDPMPRYFFSRTPLLKKYSPGASDVPASIEPIITAEEESLSAT